VKAKSKRIDRTGQIDRTVGRPRGAEHEAAVGWSHRSLRDSEPEGVRLQKVLSQAGIASRRAGEELIVQGRVKVNGAIANELGVRVDPENDAIEVDGQAVEVRPTAIVIALNKPSGVLSTAADDQGRQTVMDMVPETPGLYPVGRLDAETTGLILLTTIGELAHRLMHPKYQVERTYFAEVKGVPTRTTLQALRHGVELEDGPAKAVRAKVIDEQTGRAHVEVVMTEGRNREVRRMLESVGHPVRHLGRTAIGPIKLGDLGSGRIRYLSAAEIGSLKALVEL
jgi:23S rRNA pseudouridine2605 synthase